MATPDIRAEWGTQRRLAETMRHVDDSDIDELIDRFTRLGGGPRFFAKFHPQASWLWRQYHGTVLQHTWKPACLAMVLAFATVHYMESDGRDWPKFGVPHEKAVAQLLGLERAWSYVLTFATFINSFFLSQSYGFWLANKGNTRKVQGRLNDLSCLLATHAERDEQGRFTERARALLDEMARWVRLFHILFWAGQVRPARADEGASLSVLRTDRGLSRLCEREHLTRDEYELLVGESYRVSETQRHSALSISLLSAPPVVLEWICARFVQARQGALLQGGAGMETVFLDKALALRAVCASIGDDAAARMPLAYVHLVQILVDCLVALAPFALYAKVGVFTIPLVGLLCVFFRGFLALSKSFLDPFGNEDSLSENMSVHCLVCEVNAGSVRWASGIEELPRCGYSLAAGRGARR